MNGRMGGHVGIEIEPLSLWSWDVLATIYPACPVLLWLFTFCVTNTVEQGPVQRGRGAGGRG